MVSKKPKFPENLLKCLNQGLFPKLLFWILVQQGIFCVNLKRINSKTWKAKYAKHYEQWDEITTRAGYIRRSNMQANSRHRYKACLNRMTKNMELVEIQTLRRGDYRVFQFLPVPITLYLLIIESSPDSFSQPCEGLFQEENLEPQVYAEPSRNLNDSTVKLDGLRNSVPVFNEDPGSSSSDPQLFKCSSERISSSKSGSELITRCSDSQSEDAHEDGQDGFFSSQLSNEYLLINNTLEESNGIILSEKCNQIEYSIFLQGKQLCEGKTFPTQGDNPTPQLSNDLTLKTEETSPSIVSVPEVEGLVNESEDYTDLINGISTELPPDLTNVHIDSTLSLTNEEYEEYAAIIYDEEYTAILYDEEYTAILSDEG